MPLFPICCLPFERVLIIISLISRATERSDKGANCPRGPQKAKDSIFGMELIKRSKSEMFKMIARNEYKKYFELPFQILN